MHASSCLAGLRSDRRVRFGLNYVPSRRWYYIWNDWHPQEVAADFAAIARLGADHLRVQLLWPAFQPNPVYVSQTHLARLRELMTIAADHGLDVLVTVLTGWLSGYAFLPPHVERPHVLRDAAVLAEQQRLFEGVLAEIGDCANFIGVDLGNELNVLDNRLEPIVGDRWGRSLATWLRPKMRGRWIVNGVDHGPWFHGHTFSTDHLVADYDATTLHCWPLFTGSLEDGPLDGCRSTRLAAFMTRLALHAQARQGATRPVWVQEFGCSREWGSDSQRETYLRATIRHAVAAGASWFTWWCSHDISSRYRFASIEYDLGLIDADNRPKPLAAVFAEMIETFSQTPATPTNGEGTATPAIPLDFRPATTTLLPETQWMRQNHHTTTWLEFDRYLAGAAGGGERGSQAFF